MRYTDEGEGLPVLFLHAFPYHRGQWEGQRAALRGRARFLSMDARGIGADAEAPRTYMLEQLVDDAIALLDARGIERAVLCGCSMGGYIALRLIERAPARVCGLLLSDTQAAPDSDEAKLGRAAGLRTLAQDGKAAFAAAQLKRQLSASTREEIRARLLTMIEQSSSDGIAAALVAIATRTDTRASLAKITVPATVIVGADDAITTPTVVRALADEIAGADFHVLPNAGHLPNVEAEAQFNRLLLELLARCA
ncbi:MAG: alpha/beta hydrolase [Polyangiales bacterium]